MEKAPNFSETKNPLKLEHLKDKKDAIIACVGTPDDFKKKSDSKFYSDMVQRESRGIRNVDYYGAPKELARQNFKNAGKDTYVISPIDSTDKFSEGFLNCTGFVVAGRDKKTKENISFVSHQDPDYFLSSPKNKTIFTSDLKKHFEELREKSAEGTVDAMIVGGNYFEESASYWKYYLDSIKLLSAEAKKILGFEPVVITGPKTGHGGRDDIFYDNKNRRLYIIRPEVGGETTESYLESNISKQEKKWKGWPSA